MKFFYFYLLKVILLIFFHSSSGLSFNRSEMCSSDEYEDCSFQLSSGEKNICHIRKLNKCSSNNMNPNLSTSKLSEKEDKFSVSIQPYIAEVNDLHFSAINISITVFHKDIDGFSMMIEDDISNKTLCRLIDFQSFSKEITAPITLFYDCFYNLVEWKIQNVKITFLSLPMNNELSYYVHIPPIMAYDFNCMWQIAIMIFANSLDEGIVHVKFMPSPDNVNISSYTVKLIEEMTSNVIRTHNIKSLSRKDMIHVTFSSVKDGFYYVSILPESFRNCGPAKTAMFHIRIYTADKTLIFYVCIIVLLLLSCFAALKCFKIYKYPDLQPKQALLVHSFDCPEHESFISSFSTYLTNEYKLNVSTIYGKEENLNNCTVDKNTVINIKDPKQWLRHKYREADIIIFIISEGLFITLGSDETVYVKEGTPWREQISSIKEYISLQLFNFKRSPIKKFCKVIFPYSNEQQIPQCLNDMGPCFKLPRNFNKFLCFVFGCNSLFQVIHSNPLSSAYGQEMLKNMELVQTAVTNKTNIIVIERKSFAEASNENHSPSGNNFSVCRFSFTSPDTESEDSETCDIDISSINHNNMFLKEWQNIFSSVYKNYRTSENNRVELLLQKEFTHV